MVAPAQRVEARCEVNCTQQRNTSAARLPKWEHACGRAVCVVLVYLLGSAVQVLHSSHEARRRPSQACSCASTHGEQDNSPGRRNIHAGGVKRR